MKDIILVSLGLLLCSAGIFLFAGMYSFEFSSHSVKRIILGGAALIVVWGIITVVFRHRAFIVNLNVSLISFAVVAPFIAEIVIRSSIALGVDVFRNPKLYADPLNDDDYWKLRYIWNPRNLATGNAERFVVDQLLGWSPPKTRDNTMGIVSDAPYSQDFRKPAILFYGDSFVYGATLVPIPQRIPQQLDRLLQTYPVYNYGVSAFGVDQIFLRFRETHSAFQHPIIIFGILTEDIDRSVLNVHAAPKPRFELQDGELDLQNIPIPEDSAKWYMQNPVAIKSYFIALFRRTYQIVTGGSGRRIEKERVNKKIIEAVVNEARKHDLPIVFVVFYSRHELEDVSWRETFLKNLLEELGIPYIDTKAVLHDAAKEQSINIREFYLYRYNNDHHNELGNCVIAAAITGTLADKIGTEITSIKPANCFD
ncbi:MAG: hypothetical protein EP297_11085 [Gammaproteobacteria bacterium]|nr:MAG: hypothetical protein EP297_11085 [Gammaproteobacteria bacterium]